MPLQLPQLLQPPLLLQPEAPLVACIWPAGTPGGVRGATFEQATRAESGGPPPASSAYQLLPN